MSLPKGMKWVENAEVSSGINHAEVWSVNDYQLYEFHGERMLYFFDGRLICCVRNRAQAELIIRVLEAPETLEVKDELT